MLTVTGFTQANPVALALAAATGSSSAVASSISITVELFGVPLPVLLAAFTGAVGALAFLPPMTRKQAFSAVAIGTLCAVYGSPLIARAINWPPESHAGIAFVVGVAAHWILTIAFTDGRKWINDHLGKGPQ